MKQYVAGLLLTLLSSAVFSLDEVSTTVPVAELSSVVNAEQPAPIMVSSYPKLREKYAGHEDVLLKYRFSPNLPEITSKALLDGVGDKNIFDKLNRGEEKIGFIPRLTIVPCDDGCLGNGDYDKAVKRFLGNYNQGVAKGHFAYRGNMTVKVRWFKQRGFLEKQMPIPANRDVFAIAFPVEGKLITISLRDGSKQSDMNSLAVKASGMLWSMLVLQMGVGIKPFPLLELLPQAERNWLKQTNDALAPVVLTLDQFFGAEDQRSRIEPMGPQFNNLLPAVDGIGPNEVAPIAGPVFLNGI